MATENKQTENQPSKPVISSCGKKEKIAGATFVQNVRARFDGFINTPMAQHKQCFNHSVKKMLNTAKFWGEKKPEAKEVDSPLPLQTTPAK